MKVRFLGTASGAGVPALFCKCEICRKARDLGGKNIRSRSSIQIDRDCQIGLTPDVFGQTATGGHPISDIRSLLLTHNHYDHFCPESLRYRRPPYAYGKNETLTIYGTDSVLDALRAKVRNPQSMGFELVQWQSGMGHQLPDMEVIPIPIQHDPRQTCYALAVIRDDRRLLWAVDLAEADDYFFDSLPEDMQFDMVVLDCALGQARHKSGSAHLNIEKMIEAARKFEMTDRLTRRGRIYACHLTHHTPLMHQELELEFHEKQEDIDVAYDGLSLNLNKDD